MVSSSGPKATWAGRVRRAGIRRWARRDGGALVRHSRRKVQRICRRARRGGGAHVRQSWTISSGNSRFQVSGPWQRAGRTSQVCRDMRGCPCVAQGARVSLPAAACGPTDTQAGSPRWRGARASLRGCIAVNKQCFKLRVQAEGSQSQRRSACQSVKGLGTGRRLGPESGNDEESGQVKL